MTLETPRTILRNPSSALLYPVLSRWRISRVSSALTTGCHLTLSSLMTLPIRLRPVMPNTLTTLKISGQLLTSCRASTSWQTTTSWSVTLPAQRLPSNY